MIDLSQMKIEELKSLKKQVEKQISILEKEINKGILTKWLTYLKKFYPNNNEFVLCSTYKSDEAPYEITSYPFSETEDENLVQEIDENGYDEETDEELFSLFEFDEFSEQFYPNGNNLYPGQGMLVYMDFNGKTWAKVEDF